MFRCFVDSVIRPKNIANHINMKLGKLIGYLILIILISSIPSIITIFTSDSVPEQYASIVVSDLKKTEVKLDYTINDGKLVSKSNNQSVHIFELALFSGQTANSQFDLVSYIVFNQTDEDIARNGKLTKLGLLLNLKSDKIEVSLFNPGNEEDKTNLIASGTYNELGANGIDFSDLNNYSTYTLQMRLEGVIKNLFKTYLLFGYLGSIPSAIFATGVSVLFEIAILVIIVFIFFRYSRLTVGELIRIVTLCMTPTAIIGIYMLLPFGTAWYYGLYFIGQIITFIYFYKATRQVFINKTKKE